MRCEKVEIRISIVVAVAENRVIGLNGKLPWRLPKDMDHFKDITIGGTVVMGRETYLSIDEKYRPLRHRINIVLSRKGIKVPPGVIVCSSWEEVMRVTAGKEEIFVIGGQQIYEIALPEAMIIYRTLVQAEPQGDAHFPELNMREWDIESSELVADPKGTFPYFFQTLRRRV